MGSIAACYGDLLPFRSVCRLALRSLHAIGFGIEGYGEERLVIVELVTFKAPAGADWEGILADARTTIPRWQSNPDLVRKHYLVSEDEKSCAGLYIWPSRAAAEQAHDAAWRASIERRTGSTPHIVYFSLMMLLDNEAGTLTEWSSKGEKRTVAAV